MHELSIAKSLLRLVLGGAHDNRAIKVLGASLKIGEYAGVEIDLLERAFIEISRGTIAEGAKLEIIHDPFVIRCDLCKKDFKMQKFEMVCPQCHDTKTSIIGGHKMDLINIEISV